MRTLRWLMGDLDVAGYGPIVASLPLAIAGTVAFATLPRAQSSSIVRKVDGRHTEAS